MGVRQRRPRAKFNLHFINLASVYVNCLMNGPKSGKKETYSKPRVLSGNQSSSELTRHPRETRIHTNAMETTRRASEAVKAVHGYCTSREWLGRERK